MKKSGFTTLLLLAIVITACLFWLFDYPEKGEVMIHTPTADYSSSYTRVRGYYKYGKIHEKATYGIRKELEKKEAFIYEDTYEIAFNGDVFLGPLYYIYDNDFQYLYSKSDADMIIPESKGVYYLAVYVTWGSETEYIVCEHYFKLQVN